MKLISTVALAIVSMAAPAAMAQTSPHDDGGQGPNIALARLINSAERDMRGQCRVWQEDNPGSVDDLDQQARSAAYAFAAPRHAPDSLDHASDLMESLQATIVCRRLLDSRTGAPAR